MLKRIFFILVSVFFVGKAFAVDDYLCDATCQNVNKYAIDVAKNRSVGYMFNVFDFERYELATFQVIQIDGGIGSLKVPKKIESNSSAKSKYENLVRMKSELEFDGGLVPSDLANSAWDLVGRSSLENDVSDWVNLKYFNRFRAVMLHYGNSFGVTDVAMTIKVTFSDGSTKVYELKGVTATGDLVVVPRKGSGVDSENNSIPEEKKNFDGAYEFNSDLNSKLFQDAASRLNVGIDGTAYQSCGIFHDFYCSYGSCWVTAYINCP